MLLKKLIMLSCLLSLPIFVGAGFQMDGVAGSGAAQRVAAGPVNFPPITVASAQVPADIPGGAPGANLNSAGIFAWQEFIALNWPALVGPGEPRDTPDVSQPFGQGATGGTVVWHTYRGKVEIFPGTGAPPGGVGGYDDPPRYVYSEDFQSSTYPGVGGPYDSLQPGEVPACTDQAPVAQPSWINLDETTQIGLDKMYAGTAPSDGIPGQQILFLAKANRQEYDYVVPKNWYDGTTIDTVENRTIRYLKAHRESPAAGSSQFVSFPSGTIEVKSAWRRLGANDNPSRFATATVRYYQPQDPSQVYGGQQGNSELPCWSEATFGLLALHIIHKTPTAPYFVYATFSQADNLLDAQGNPVEDDDGAILPGQGGTKPLDPDIGSKNATSANPEVPKSIQRLQPERAYCVPQERLYYQNSQYTPTPQGTVCVNRRKNSIPGQIINVNQAAHQAMRDYFGALTPRVDDSPWLHYKLVNVQFAPINKPRPGHNYNKADAATYYQANEVVETDYNLQEFSGHFQGTLAAPFEKTPIVNLITDFLPNGRPFHNTIYNKALLQVVWVA
jgi:hypothetical protein